MKVRFKKHAKMEGVKGACGVKRQQSMMRSSVYHMLTKEMKGIISKL